jgi:hypothetical protein
MVRSASVESPLQFAVRHWKEPAMDFLKLWMIGYISPSRLVTALRDRPAPLYGTLAQSLRALLDALLLYLPLALMGRRPSTPSYLTFVPTARYYRAAIVLAPAVLMVQWLFLSFR